MSGDKPRLVWTSLANPCWYVLRNNDVVTTFAGIREASRHWWFVERPQKMRGKQKHVDNKVKTR
jgi:hypothetical protein